MSLDSTTLEELRQEVVDWCDIPDDTSSTHISTTMLNRWINKGIRRLTALLCGLYTDDYYTAVAALSTSAGVATVSLPSRCQRVKGVYWVKDSEDVRLLERVQPEAFVDGGPGATPVNPKTWESSPRYALMGQVISFVPVPSAVYALRLSYVQSLAELSLDADTWEFGLGWDEWVIADVCQKVLRRKDRDWQQYNAVKAEAERHIREAATDRDESAPPMARRLHGGSMDPRSRYDRATYDD